MSASCPGVSTPASTSPMRRDAAVLEDRLDDRAVLLGQLRARSVGVGLVERLDLHVQRALVADGAAARRGPGRRRGSPARACRWAARRRSRSGRSCRPWRSGRRSRGTSTRRRPACSAAAPARLASSVSSAIVTTICGNTTPCVSGSNGSSSARVSGSRSNPGRVIVLLGHVVPSSCHRVALG